MKRTIAGGDLAERIEEVGRNVDFLSHTDQAKRQEGAEALFALGTELAWPIAQEWIKDPALADNFHMVEYGVPAGKFPETTVGVAVTPNNFMRIRNACGLPPEADVPPDQDAREIELHFPNEVRIDVLTSRNPAGTGALARFLQRQGEGIQQVEFRVKSVLKAEETLQSAFHLRPVYPHARLGANGSLVNFFLLPARKDVNVLIEIFEPA